MYLVGHPSSVIRFTGKAYLCTLDETARKNELSARLLVVHVYGTQHFCIPRAHPVAAAAGHCSIITLASVKQVSLQKFSIAMSFFILESPAILET